MKDLEQSLLNAKKFMEHGAMNKGGSKRDVPTNSNIPSNLQEAQLPNVSVPRQPNMNPKANMSKEAIMKSALPDAIKKAMIQNPIPDPVPSGNLSESFMDKVSKKMHSEEYSVGNMRNTANSDVSAPKIVNSQDASTDPIPTLGESNLDRNSLKETLRECLMEILKEEKILMETTKMKENLQLRVGNKIFTGNIKSVKTVK